MRAHTRSLGTRSPRFAALGDGFRRAFDKKGLLWRKRNTTLTVEFREPIRFAADATTEEILTRLQHEIGLDHAE
jgi:hypothetical protein